MTIRKGEPWGEPADLPPGTAIAADDAEASRLVAEGAGAVALAGGDLARTMGGGTAGRLQRTVVRAPVDVLRVTLDGAHTVAVAHVVARPAGRLGWWHGELVLVMNAQFLGPYDVAPRGHPNDGRVDILHVEGRMGVRARWAARARARTGTHLPHPQLMMRQTADAQYVFDRPLQVWVDGRRWRRGTELHLVVEPDAFTVYA